MLSKMKNMHAQAAGKAFTRVVRGTKAMKKMVFPSSSSSSTSSSSVTKQQQQQEQDANKRARTRMTVANICIAVYEAALAAEKARESSSVTADEQSEFSSDAYVSGEDCSRPGSAASLEQECNGRQHDQACVDQAREEQQEHDSSLQQQQQQQRENVQRWMDACLADVRACEAKDPALKLVMCNVLEHLSKGMAQQQDQSAQETIAVASGDVATPKIEHEPAQPRSFLDEIAAFKKASLKPCAAPLGDAPKSKIEHEPAQPRSFLDEIAAFKKDSLKPCAAPLGDAPKPKIETEQAQPRSFLDEIAAFKKDSLKPCATPLGDAPKPKIEHEPAQPRSFLDEIAAFKKDSLKPSTLTTTTNSNNPESLLAQVRGFNKQQGLRPITPAPAKAPVAERASLLNDIATFSRQNLRAVQTSAPPKPQAAQNIFGGAVLAKAAAAKVNSCTPMDKIKVEEETFQEVKDEEW